MPKIIMSIVVGTTLALLSSLATAQIYTWKDAEGNTVFSDQPHPNARTIDLPATNVLEPSRQQSPSSSNDTPPNETTEQSRYDDLTIISPSNDESIRSNEGTLSLQVQIEPALDSGHVLRAELDDQLTGPAIPASGQTSATLILRNVDRGTHNLNAVVINARGEIVQRSPSITVHLLRTSTNQPARQVPAPAPTPTP